jgi:hypothetical protein
VYCGDGGQYVGFVHQSAVESGSARGDGADLLKGSATESRFLGGRADDEDEDEEGAATTGVEDGVSRLAVRPSSWSSSALSSCLSSSHSLVSSTTIAQDLQHPEPW